MHVHRHVYLPVLLYQPRLIKEEGRFGLQKPELIFDLLDLISCKGGQCVDIEEWWLRRSSPSVCNDEAADASQQARI